MRNRAIYLCAFLVVLLLAVPDAMAQGGRRGGGGGRGGGGRAGGGQRQPQAQRQRPARPDANQGRRETSERGRGLFAGKSPSSNDLSSLLRQGSTGRFPSSEKSRSSLASSLSTSLQGKTLSADQTAKLSDAVAAGANPDGLSKEDLAAKKGSLQSTLAGAGVPQEQIDQVASAFDQVVSEQQQANLQTLATDLQQLQSESAVTQEQVKELSTSLQAMADGATKPSQESVDELATDLSAALDDGSLSPMEQASLTRDLQAVLDSANIETSEVTAAIEDAKTILEASNVDQADVQKIVADLEAIYSEMQVPK